ncbi:MAG: methylmalonyl-CoA mutase [bacterium P3]|nr:MAG: methylmalonyl-CoA mutase [bacterium P3]KWW42451.1 MAG: methylmalonyl-CoA mutase [bacterium F083]
MEDNKLFGEFPPVPTEKWEEVINKDLKGADYDKKLVWKTIEGFNVKPYYRAEDLEHLEYLDSNPASQPYTRGKKSDNNIWDIRQDIHVRDAARANAIARDAVQRGATALGLCAKDITSVDAMQTLLDGINPEKVKIHFNCSRDYMTTLQLFIEVLHKEGRDPEKVEGTCNFDIFHYTLKHGRFYRSEEEDLLSAKALVEFAKSRLPHFRVLTIGGSMLHNAGSNIVQELGFSMAAANEMVARLTDLGCSADQVASSIAVNFATGGNYFMEIAKIRAARLLWSKIVEQYHPACDCAYRLFINSVSSTWNKSVFDPYVNMLRTTTETMSAAIAGADSISTIPFDCAYKEADDFGYRIARNQQLLLKEESYMDKIVDPAAGSYYIEHLTDSIACHAWDLFVTVEGKGGFCKAIRAGYVQDEVERIARQRDNDIATRKTTILGTNQYPNLIEQMSDKIMHTETCGCCCDRQDGDIKTLHPYRGAEPFEALRIATERCGHRPRVFLLTYGNLAMRKARSGFATNFFGVAGYEIIDNAGFKSAEEGVQAALKANADIVVLCSSDDEYAEIAEAACKGLKGKVKSIVLAGYPKEMVDTYRSYGIDEFIHVKTNALECLTAFQKLMGVM